MGNYMGQTLGGCGGLHPDDLAASRCHFKRPQSPHKTKAGCHSTFSHKGEPQTETDQSRAGGGGGAVVGGRHGLNLRAGAWPSKALSICAVGGTAMLLHRPSEDVVSTGQGPHGRGRRTTVRLLQRPSAGAESPPQAASMAARTYAFSPPHQRDSC